MKWHMIFWRLMHWLKVWLKIATGMNPVTFTMEPVSTTLVSGTVDVTTYDANLQPTTASHIFNGIALDDWMRAFLFAVDSLLSPGSAPVIAGLPAPDPATNSAPPFERLMAAKKALAKHLATRVVPVFQSETGQATGWQGDLASARDKFEQLLLQELSQAYTNSVGHEFPPTPMIASQNAEGDPRPAKPTDPIRTIIQGALEWDYTLTVAERELEDEQDDLWLMLSYNLPDSGGHTHSQTYDAVAPAPQSALFASLAQFTIAYQSLSGLLPQLQVGAKPTAGLQKLAEILAGLAENVSGALETLTGGQEVALDTADPSAPDDAPVSFTDIYVVEFLHALDTQSPYLTVYAKVKSAADTVIWPTIAWMTDPPSGWTTGTPDTGLPVRQYGVMEGLWKQARYDLLAAPTAKLRLKWQGFSMLDRQTVRPQVQVLRNAHLAERVHGMITNPALVYRTPLVTAPRLVPYVCVSQTIDVPFTTDLPTTLTQILTPFFDADTSIGTGRKFKVEIGYEYALSTHSQDKPLVVTNAILLVDGLELGGSSSVSVGQFAEQVSAQIEAWMNAVGTDNTVPRWITLAISLFANLNQTELPLISLACVRIKDLPANWPTSR
jgi:hypothetical protein